MARSPGWTLGDIPTPEEWAAAFATKADSGIDAFGAVADCQTAILLASVAVGGNTLTVALPTAWAPSTAYTAGQVQTNNGWAFVAITAGTSGTTGPLCRRLDDAPIADGTGTLTWNWLGAAPATAGVFAPGDVGKSIQVIRNDIANGWSPWYHSTVGQASVPKIVGYVSPTQVTIDRAGDVACPSNGTSFPAQSWPYAATPSVVVWGTDNSAALQAAIDTGDAFVPPGRFGFAAQQIIPSGTTMRGGAGSVLVPMGVVTAAGVPGSAMVNTAYQTYWAAFEGSSGSMPNFAQTLAADGDHDIVVRDLTIDMTASGMALGGDPGRFFLVRGVKVSNLRVVGARHAASGAPGFIACVDAAFEDSELEAVTAAFAPWGGCKRFRFNRNTVTIPQLPLQSVTYGGVASDPFVCVWINIVGTALGDDQSSWGFEVKDNTVYINGALATQAPTVGIGVFPDGTGSVYRNYQISGNKIVCTGERNWPLFVNGAGTSGIIDGNLIDGCDGSGNSACIQVTSEPAGSGNPTSVSTVAGSSTITLTWPAHGFDAVNLAAGPVWFYTNGPLVVGGITIQNSYRIIAVPDANTIQIKAIPGSVPTATATAAWSPTFQQIRPLPVGLTVSNNRLVNCQAPAGVSLIQTLGVGIIVRDNAASLPSAAAPTYLALVSMDAPNNEAGGAAINNCGPAGTGSVTAGNNRVTWNQYGSVPVVVDPGVV